MSWLSWLTGVPAGDESAQEIHDPAPPERYDVTFYFKGGWLRSEKKGVELLRPVRPDIVWGEWHPRHADGRLEIVQRSEVAASVWAPAKPRSALSVPCPHCDSKVGDPCTAGGGLYVVSAHLQRVYCAAQSAGSQPEGPA